MNHLVAELEAAVAAWDERGWPRPDVLIVSGSGLAVDLPGATGRSATLQELVPFETHSVVGHPYRVELLETRPGTYGLYQRGRVHSYQGHSAAETVFVVRLAALLGARRLLMTNAAGGLAPSHRRGAICAIADQINLIGLNPLRGQPPEEWGPRFPDMVDCHDHALRRIAVEESEKLGLELGSGVYCGLAGPSYETPAEIAMLRALGAELVGMSTVLEVIAARHMSVRCLCLSLITNLAAGTEGPLDHQEVLDAGRDAAGDLGRLLAAVLVRPDFYAD